MAESASNHEKCRFFRGIQHATCSADVEMERLPRPLPCLQLVGRPAAPDTCPKRAWMTAEDHAAREAEIRSAVERLGKCAEDGKCHVCGADAEPSRVIGRCKYNACGHRVGQVL